MTSGNSYTQRYQLASSKPIGGETWWAFATNEDPTTPGKLRAYAVCAKVSDISVVQTP
ncbi:hypothetical protein [Streptomyces sp. NPDC050145]|uniref:hypothetical protein n=1 Tax=Streptomyces sp. NPDC050145 TaxID=3365602 RepID=UPI00378A1435